MISVCCLSFRLSQVFTSFPGLLRWINGFFFVQSLSRDWDRNCRVPSVDPHMVLPYETKTQKGKAILLKGMLEDYQPRNLFVGRTCDRTHAFGWWGTECLTPQDVTSVFALCRGLDTTKVLVRSLGWLEVTGYGHHLVDVIGRHGQLGTDRQCRCKLRELSDDTKESQGLDQLFQSGTNTVEKRTANGTEPTLIWQDNKTCILLSKNECSSAGRCKHFDAKIRSVAETISNGVVKIRYTPSSYNYLHNYSDILTKPLRELIHKMIDGLHSITCS